jgi:hypothetical protein
MMQMLSKFKPAIRSLVPATIRDPVRRQVHRMLIPLARLYPKLRTKADSELQFWEEWIAEQGVEPETEY